jgi:hypothetical protein
MTDDTVWYVRGQIMRWVDKDPQPGIVECQFTDMTGRQWVFIGKFYDFTTAELWSDSIYPLPGYIVCEIVSRHRDESGREIVEIDSEKPYRGRESEDGVAPFCVLAEQLVPDALPAWREVQL